MAETINAAGLPCPEPVIRTRKALQNHNVVDVIVDNETALENVKRLGEKEGCTIDTAPQSDGTWILSLTRKGVVKEVKGSAESTPSAKGQTVVVISEDRMGRGNDELGYVLIRGFIHTLLELDTLPDTLIFYNTGVKLAADDSEVIEDLKKMEGLGIELLICGTCINYFEITEKISTGIVSNMFDIASKMTEADKLVMP